MREKPFCSASLADKKLWKDGGKMDSRYVRAIRSKIKKGLSKSGYFYLDLDSPNMGTI